MGEINITDLSSPVKNCSKYGIMEGPEMGALMEESVNSWDELVKRMRKDSVYGEGLDPVEKHCD